MTFPAFAARDALFIAASVLLWRFVAPLSAGSGPLADLSGLAAGLAVGFCVYLLHEWGHLLAALAVGSDVRSGEGRLTISLFSFDSKTNSRAQFLVMSVGGFIVTGVALFGFYTLLPDGLLATRIARGVVVFLTVLAVVLEFPLVIWALVRNDLPPVETLAAHKQSHVPSPAP